MVMNQEYIVYAIISLAIVYTAYGIVKALQKKDGDSACGGCASCEFKQQAKKNLARKQKQLQKQSIECCKM
jgi:hypothetical protein